VTRKKVLTTTKVKTKTILSTKKTIYFINIVSSNSNILQTVIFGDKIIFGKQ
jgi:hypothetical protein